MGEIAEGLINGDFDFYTGEYLGRGSGFPRSRYGQVFGQPRKSQNLSWKKVTNFMNQNGIKQHLHPSIIQEYGATYKGKSPLRNACFEILKDFDKFKAFIQQKTKQND